MGGQGQRQSDSAARHWQVNSSPITAILSVVKLKHGCNHAIVIPGACMIAVKILG